MTLVLHIKCASPTVRFTLHPIHLGNGLIIMLCTCPHEWPIFRPILGVSPIDHPLANRLTRYSQPRALHFIHVTSDHRLPAYVYGPPSHPPHPPPAPQRQQLTPSQYNSTTDNSHNVIIIQHWLTISPSLSVVHYNIRSLCEGHGLRYQHLL